MLLLLLLDGVCTLPLPPDVGTALRFAWDSSLDGSVVRCAAEVVDESDAEAFVLDRLTLWSTVIVGLAGIEHLVISDGFSSLRLDITSGTLTEGPVRLHYHLSGFAGAELKLLTLQRLIALNRLGRFARAHERHEAKADRWLMMLRAHDLSLAGATQRDIAVELFGLDVASDWRTGSDFLRLRVQRLLRDANAMISGGYRQLLSPPSNLGLDASR